MPPISRLMFSSLAAPDVRDEAGRYASWFDEYRASIGGREIIADREAPFAAKVEYMALGPCGLGRSSGSTIRLERRREHVSRDGDSRFLLILNRSRAASAASTRSGQAAVAPGAAILFDFAEPSTHAYPGGYNSITLHLPRAQLLAALPHAEDLGGSVIEDGQALRLLAAYADCLIDDRGLGEAAVLSQAGQGLLDLAVLALGADRDQAEAARLGGVRAAHLAAILRHIRRDFANPELSPELVAQGAGISTRYLHALLQETGASFSERVTDLRLAKALALLTHGKPKGKISDAAYTAGFNDLSQFNRRFRQRYGMTPRAARGRSEGV